MECPFDQFKPAVSSQLLVHPSLLVAGQLCVVVGNSGVKKKASIHTVQALLGNSQNTAPLSALFWSGIQNTAPYQLLGRQLTVS